MDNEPKPRASWTDETGDTNTLTPPVGSTYSPGTARVVREAVPEQPITTVTTRHAAPAADAAAFAVAVGQPSAFPLPAPVATLQTAGSALAGVNAAVLIGATATCLLVLWSQLPGNATALFGAVLAIVVVGTLVGARQAIKTVRADDLLAALPVVAGLGVLVAITEGYALRVVCCHLLLIGGLVFVLSWLRARDDRALMLRVVGGAVMLLGARSLPGGLW